MIDYTTVGSNNSLGYRLAKLGTSVTSEKGLMLDQMLALTE